MYVAFAAHDLISIEVDSTQLRSVEECAWGLLVVPVPHAWGEGLDRAGQAACVFHQIVTITM